MSKRHPTIEEVSMAHHTPIGVALRTVVAGETVKVIVQSGSDHYIPIFEASDDIAVGAIVMFRQTKWERVRGWLIRKLSK